VLSPGLMDFGTSEAVHVGLSIVFHEILHRPSERGTSPLYQQQRAERIGSWGAEEAAALTGVTPHRDAA
jgi:hypothetical protein